MFDIIPSYLGRVDFSILEETKMATKYKGVVLQLRDDKPEQTTRMQCYLPSVGLKVGNEVTLKGKGRDPEEWWIVMSISKEETEIDDLQKDWRGEGIDYHHPASAKLDFEK